MRATTNYHMKSFKIHRKKILIADDDRDIVDAMKVILENEGFEVIITQHAQDVLSLCYQHPDLVFIDIWMSGEAGDEVCKQIKSQDQLKDIPIIIFSANNDTRQIAMDSGADGFLLKPFDLNDLLALAYKHAG